MNIIRLKEIKMDTALIVYLVVKLETPNITKIAIRNRTVKNELLK